MLDWFLDPDPDQPDEGVRSHGGQPLPRGRSPLQDQHRQGVPVPEGGPHSRELPELTQCSVQTRASKSSIRRFVITEKATTRAFS